MPIKITYIISNINKALAFEWIALHLNKSKFDLRFILLNSDNSELEVFLNTHNIPVKRIKYRGKKDFVFALIRCWYQLIKWKTTIVHTHLFDANMIGLLSAKLAGIQSRIHTRHHSSFHHEYFPNAIKYDLMVNQWSTKIIAITGIVKDILVLKENVPLHKIDLIHHGFDLALFQNPDPDAINLLKEKYQTKEHSPVIGVIARQTKWKGVEYIIDAFKELRNEYPKAKLLLANATGDGKGSIDDKLKLLPKDSFKEIIFENDLPSLYQLFDVYVHTPIDNHSEAFGQTYVEALASGIPSVFTLSGIANDFIKHEENALVVDYCNSDEIQVALHRLLNDNDLRQRVVENGKKSIQQFELNKFIAKLEKLYSNG